MDKLDKIWKSDKMEFIPVNGLILLHSFDHFRLYRVFFCFFLSIVTNCLKFGENRKASQALEIY